MYAIPFLTWPQKHTIQQVTRLNLPFGQQDGCDGDVGRILRAKDAKNEHARVESNRYFSRQSAVLHSPTNHHTFAARPIEMSWINEEQEYRIAGNGTRYELTHIQLPPPQSMKHICSMPYPWSDDRVAATGTILQQYRRQLDSVRMGRRMRLRMP
jgi:hypothetical protein